MYQPPIASCKWVGFCKLAEELLNKPWIKTQTKRDQLPSINLPFQMWVQRILRGFGLVYEINPFLNASM
jgi:hypothetical protein